MVLLFASIREAFDRVGRGYELTFTIPASYWYLRWFDMPGLMQYADWTNLVRHPSLIFNRLRQGLISFLTLPS